MADIETHPDPDVFGVVEYLISQVEHIKPESKSSIDETIAAVAAASSSTVETVQKKKRALRDRTNIPAATTTADGETPKKRGRKRKSDELPSQPQPQPPTTTATATTTTARSTRSAEKRKHEDENQPEDNKENAVPPPVTKRQRTPRKQVVVLVRFLSVTIRNKVNVKNRTYRESLLSLLNIWTIRKRSSKLLLS